MVDENKLKAMHIYDLRDYARYVGVRSPASYSRKACLIAAIQKVEQGIVSPYKPDVVKGRKPMKRAERRIYISREDAVLLKEENYLLVTEKRKLINALSSIGEILNGVLKSVRD